MSINPIAASAMAAQQATSTQNSSTAASSTPDSLANSSSDLFLQLLVAQLKTQDPTSPMDPTQMVGQMFSMNQLEQLISINQTLTAAFPPATNSSSTGSGSSAPHVNTGAN